MAERTKNAAWTRWTQMQLWGAMGKDATEGAPTDAEVAVLAAAVFKSKLTSTRNDRRFPNTNQANSCWCVRGRGGDAALDRGARLRAWCVRARRSSTNARRCVRARRARIGLPLYACARRTAFNEYQLCVDKRGDADSACLQRGRDYDVLCPKKWVSRLVEPLPLRARALDGAAALHARALPHARTHCAGRRVEGPDRQRCQHERRQVLPRPVRRPDRS